MKQGTTPTLDFKLDIEISNVTEVIFTFTDELAYKGTSEDETASYLLQKNYPDDATFEDDTFKLPLTQEETDLLTNTFFVEAQVICDKAVVKSDIKKVNMPHTLWTTYVDDNESDGQSEVIHLSFSDNVIVEGGGSSNYNDLTNKPRINNIELIGNKTDTDLGLATKTELNAKQNVISGGNGIDVTSDVVSVALKEQQNYMVFTDGKLGLDLNSLGSLPTLRQALVNTSYVYSLASKTYVDNLMSGAVKRLVVQTLPTEDIDTNTIYMVLKSVPTTNNIYDEYMYINNAWELIGNTEVDLSNYYTKTESDNKYQNKLTVGNGIDITNSEISIDISSGSIIDFYNGKLRLLGSQVANDSDFQTTMPYVNLIRQGLLTTYGDYNFQPKLTAGTNITIVDNVISANASTRFEVVQTLPQQDQRTDTIYLVPKSSAQTNNIYDEYAWVVVSTNPDTYGWEKIGDTEIDLSSYVKNTDYATGNVGGVIKIGNGLTLSANYRAQVATRTYANYLTDSDGEFIGKGTLENVISGKNLESKTTISTDTTSTTVSLTLADNHEYRYTQDLTSLTLTMPSGDFIASIVFASGSTPTSMTYDSSIKWSGEDVTSNAFVPQAIKEYDILFYYNGLSVNGVVRGV